MTNREGLQSCTSVAGPTIAKAGGKVLARCDAFEVVEGSSPGRLFVIDFPGYEAATQCFEAAQNREAAVLRGDDETADLLIAKGFALGA